LGRRQNFVDAVVSINNPTSYWIPVEHDDGEFRGGFGVGCCD
jgi:hypothetical protein